MSVIALGTIAVTWAVVKLNEASRRLTVNYAKRVQGNRTYGGVTTTLPVKLITAGVIPIIFAVAFLSVPSFAGQLLTHGQGLALQAQTFWEKLGVQFTSLFQNPTAETFAAGGWKPWVYPLTYFGLVFIFTYFYTSVTFSPSDIAKNLQRSGGFIPGIRPGDSTEKYFSRAVNRLTLFGAAFLGFIAILPIIIQSLTGIQVLTISGTALLIVVAVALETMRQINSQLTVREYEAIE